MSKSPAGTISVYPQGGQRKSVSGIIGEGKATRRAQARGARIDELLLGAYEKSGDLLDGGRLAGELAGAGQILVTA